MVARHASRCPLDARVEGAVLVRVGKMVRIQRGGEERFEIWRGQKNRESPVQVTERGKLQNTLNLSTFQIGQEQNIPTRDLKIAKITLELKDN